MKAPSLASAKEIYSNAVLENVDSGPVITESWSRSMIRRQDEHLLYSTPRKCIETEAHQLEAEVRRLQVLRLATSAARRVEKRSQYDVTHPQIPSSTQEGVKKCTTSTSGSTSSHFAAAFDKPSRRGRALPILRYKSQAAPFEDSSRIDKVEEEAKAGKPFFHRPKYSDSASPKALASPDFLTSFKPLTISFDPMKTEGKNHCFTEHDDAETSSFSAAASSKTVELIPPVSSGSILLSTVPKSGAASPLFSEADIISAENLLADPIFLLTGEENCQRLILIEMEHLERKEYYRVLQLQTGIEFSSLTSCYSSTTDLFSGSAIRLESSDSIEGTFDEMGATLNASPRIPVRVISSSSSSSTVPHEVNFISNDSSRSKPIVLHRLKEKQLPKKPVVSSSSPKPLLKKTIVPVKVQSPVPKRTPAQKPVKRTTVITNRNRTSTPLKKEKKAKDDQAKAPSAPLVPFQRDSPDDFRTNDKGIQNKDNRNMEMAKAADKPLLRGQDGPEVNIELKPRNESALNSTQIKEAGTRGAATEVCQDSTKVIFVSTHTEVSEDDHRTSDAPSPSPTEIGSVHLIKEAFSSVLHGSPEYGDELVEYIQLTDPFMLSSTLSLENPLPTSTIDACTIAGYEDSSIQISKYRSRYLHHLREKTGLVKPGSSRLGKDAECTENGKNEEFFFSDQRYHDQNLWFVFNLFGQLWNPEVEVKMLTSAFPLLALEQEANDTDITCFTENEYTSKEFVTQGLGLLFSGSIGDIK